MRRPQSLEPAARPRGAIAGVVVLLLDVMAVAGWAGASTPPTTTLVYPPWKHCYGLHRVTQTHLTLRAGFRARFEDPRGIVALKLAAEDDSTTRKDDDELTVFGVNSGQHMLIYNTSLTAIAFYGEHGRGVGQFDRPTGIAARRDGLVVVADTGNDRLHVLQYAEDRLHPVRFLAGTYGGQRLEAPQGVALEGDEIYVCDPRHQRVVVVDAQGTLRRILRPENGGRPFLIDPFAVAVIRAGSAHNRFDDDFVVVTDSSHARLVQMTPDGRVLRVRRVARYGAQVKRFDWVAIDYHGSVYVTDRSGRLHKFDRHLEYLLSIGRPGRGDYEFDEPRGISIYRRFGQIFVAERQGAQYLWTGTDVFTPSLVALQPSAAGVWTGRVRFFLTEYARVGLALVDDAGREVATLQTPRWTAPGHIDRPLRFRLEAPRATYRLQVTATPVYSARKTLTVVRQSAPLRFPASEGAR